MTGFDLLRDGIAAAGPVGRPRLVGSPVPADCVLAEGR